jgi:hypothetical protein
MPSKQESDVVVDTAPSVTKTVEGTLTELIVSSEEAAKWARTYLATGSVDAARHFMNARMRLKSLGTKQPLPNLEALIVGGYDPLDEAGREKERSILKERDGQTGL